jgi:nucleotide-binding universal stress UspA family protein
LPESDVRGVSVSWHETKGNVVNVVVKLGRLRDIVVIAHPARQSRFLPGELGKLLGLGRPLLLTGSKVLKSIGRRIAVAWKSAPEAARVIGAAMPLLAKAKKLSVLSIEVDQNRRASLDLLIEQLRWHRLPVEGRLISPWGRSAPEVLLKAVTDMKGDLLVMGAYCHSRVRETISGGFTHHMLRGVHLPVFMLY